MSTIIKEAISDIEALKKAAVEEAKQQLTPTIEKLFLQKLNESEQLNEMTEAGKGKLDQLKSIANSFYSDDIKTFLNKYKSAKGDNISLGMVAENQDMDLDDIEEDLNIDITDPDGNEFGDEDIDVNIDSEGGVDVNEFNDDDYDEFNVEEGIDSLEGKNPKQNKKMKEKNKGMFDDSSFNGESDNEDKKISELSIEEFRDIIKDVVKSMDKSDKKSSSKDKDIDLNFDGMDGGDMDMDVDMDMGMENKPKSKSKPKSDSKSEPKSDSKSKPKSKSKTSDKEPIEENDDMDYDDMEDDLMEDDNMDDVDFDNVGDDYLQEIENDLMEDVLQENQKLKRKLQSLQENKNIITKTNKTLNTQKVKCLGYIFGKYNLSEGNKKITANEIKGAKNVNELKLITESIDKVLYEKEKTKKLMSRSSKSLNINNFSKNQKSLNENKTQLNENKYNNFIKNRLQKLAGIN